MLKNKDICLWTITSTLKEYEEQWDTRFFPRKLDIRPVQYHVIPKRKWQDRNLKKKRKEKKRVKCYFIV